MEKTKECRLAAWKLNYAPALARICNNKNVQDNLRDGLPYPYTEKDAEEYISLMMASDPDTAFAFAIMADEELVGSIGAFRCGNIHSRTAELGYYIGEPYWGNGYASSAVRELCNYIFRETDIIRIFAEPFAYNQASCRVLEKSGFQYEGTLRQNAVKNGRVIDMKMYSRLREEES